MYKLIRSYSKSRILSRNIRVKSKPRDISALSLITMELIQKYVKENGAIGVDNLHRWPSNSDALGFLSVTTSAASAAELLKVY